MYSYYEHYTPLMAKRPDNRRETLETRILEADSTQTPRRRGRLAAFITILHNLLPLDGRLRLDDSDRAA